MSHSEYFVNLRASEKGKEDEFIKTDILFLNKSGMDLLFEMGKVIRNEMDKQVGLPLIYKDPQKQISEVLHQRFSLKDFDEANSLESSLVKYIKDLKEKDIIKDFNLIIEGLKSLRLERIQFWEKIQEDYKTDKEYFDKITHKNALRHQDVLTGHYKLKE